MFGVFKIINLLYIFIIIYIFFIICLGFIFKKTGRKGYIALIPFYNLWEFFVISNLKGWYSLVPLANILMFYIALFNLPKMFNKSILISLLNVLFPVIIIPIIAFNKNYSYNGYINETLKEKKLYNKPVYKSQDNETIENVIEDNIQYKKIKSNKLKK